VAAVEEAGEVHAVGEAAENLRHVVVHDKAAVGEVVRAQRLVLAVVALHLVAALVRHGRPVPRVLEDDHVARRARTDERRQPLDDGRAARLLVRQYRSLEAEPPQRLLPSACVGDAPAERRRRVRVDSHAQGAPPPAASAVSRAAARVRG
jgi:hypothetical protein